MRATPLMLMVVSANAAREMALSTHSNFSGVDGQSNYSVFPGGWYPSGYTVASDIICYGRDAKPVLPEYAPANRFSPVITAQICDSISDCGSFNQGPASDPNAPCVKVPGIRNSQYTIYMHRSRCSATRTATTFTSSDQQLYKVCEGADAWFDVYATFQLPQFLCEESCERDSSCVGYASNGQNCSLIQHHISQYSTAFTSYFKLY
jgi:hypothetical protein